MQRASKLFDEEQRKLIHLSVVEAEANTSCEIVPVVATSSGRYDRAEDTIGLWLAIIFAVVVWMIFPRQSNEAGSWGGMPNYVGLITMVAGMVVAFIFGAVVGSRIGWLRRLFIPRKQMLDEVALRARTVFFDRRAHHTNAATGILIYVSLYERLAHVLADQKVLETLGQEFLNRLCHQLTDGLRLGNPTDAICAAIRVAGKELSGPLPRTEPDANELTDSFVLLD